MKMKKLKITYSCLLLAILFITQISFAESLNSAIAKKLWTDFNYFEKPMIDPKTESNLMKLLVKSIVKNLTVENKQDTKGELLLGSNGYSKSSRTRK